MTDVRGQKHLAFLHYEAALEQMGQRGAMRGAQDRAVVLAMDEQPARGGAHRIACDRGNRFEQGRPPAPDVLHGLWYG